MRSSSRKTRTPSPPKRYPRTRRLQRHPQKRLYRGERVPGPRPVRIAREPTSPGRDRHARADRVDVGDVEDRVLDALVECYRDCVQVAIVEADIDRISDRSFGKRKNAEERRVGEPRPLIGEGPIEASRDVQCHRHLSNSTRVLRSIDYGLVELESCRPRFNSRD